MDTKIQRFDGLVIDKSGTFQTICQTIKYYQTRVWGIYSYKGYRGYMSNKDRGYRGLSIYRPNPRISNTETLNVSHNEQGGRGRGYIRNTKPFLLAYIYPIYHIHTYAGYKGLRLNGLK
jgi:hypothetical protein